MSVLWRLFGIDRRKNSKVRYFASAALWALVPHCIKKARRRRLDKWYDGLPDAEKVYISSRVNYYNKLQGTEKFEDAEGFGACALRDNKLGAHLNGHRSGSAYVIDSRRICDAFDQRLMASFCFGDVTAVPPIPSIVKSRPTGDDNRCSVLLKLDAARHFVFIDRDPYAFREKKDMLIGMAYIGQPHRRRFYGMYFGHPLCRLGNIRRGDKEHPEWEAPPICIDEHLRYKFILCLEGHDVATNLKWVMSSNSLAVMPRPKYETWFYNRKNQMYSF